MYDVSSMIRHLIKFVKVYGHQIEDWRVEKNGVICYSESIFVKEVLSMDENDLLNKSKGRRFGGSLAAGIALGIGGGGAVGAALGNVFIGGLIGLVLGVLLGLAMGNVKRPEA